MNPSSINSTSSVSTTRRKREAERSVNWTVEETQVLLCAWSDERIQKSLAENLRNRHVFKHLSARMSEMGFSRSPHQCRLRVKTLKANYVRAKLQRSMDSAQLCTFKYFEEMDAVLGRRAAEAGGAAYFVSADRMAGCRPNTADTIPTDLYSNAEVSGHRFGSLGRGERQRLSSSDGRRPSLHRDTEVKLEITDDSTDDFEFSDFGFAQQQQQRRDRQHDAYLESSIPPEAADTPVENAAPPHVLPPPLLPEPVASPLTATPDPRPSTLPASGRHHPESTCLESVLKHLSGSFQQLVADTRSLLMQLESQRQEQARWHQELLAQWLQREERRQRDAAEREERREKARMEHEIRVLELLTGLAKEQGCKCGSSWTAGEATNHTITKHGT